MRGPPLMGKRDESEITPDGAELKTWFYPNDKGDGYTCYIFLVRQYLQYYLRLSLFTFNQINEYWNK